MAFNTLTPLVSLSPLDGRYAAKVDALRGQFSEFGLIRRRLQVEIEWLKALAAEPHFAEIPAFSTATIAALDQLVAEFSPEQAGEVKEIEAVTNHDVKALEYCIKNKLADNLVLVKGLFEDSAPGILPEIVVVIEDLEPKRPATASRFALSVSNRVSRCRFLWVASLRSAHSG